MRRHTLDDEPYPPISRSGRSSERERAAAAYAGRSRRSLDAETPMRKPSIRKKHRDDLGPRMSSLAGLTGPGRGMNRVFEWRDYVEPGVPDGEIIPVPA